MATVFEASNRPHVKTTHEPHGVGKGAFFDKL